MVLGVLIINEPMSLKILEKWKYVVHIVFRSKTAPIGAYAINGTKSDE